MADLNGHEAGNGGHSQGKPTAYRDSSTRREAMFQQLTCVQRVPSQILLNAGSHNGADDEDSGCDFNEAITLT
jgi:hypothetical protein